MNNAGVDLTFCVIFCSKLMAACKIADCRNMFLTPVLEIVTTSEREQHFQAKFRYRAKGRYPEERDGHRVSYGQLQRDDLLRPFSKSAGLPSKALTIIQSNISFFLACSLCWCLSHSSFNIPSLLRQMSQPFVAGLLLLGKKYFKAIISALCSKVFCRNDKKVACLSGGHDA